VTHGTILRCCNDRGVVVDRAGGGFASGNIGLDLSDVQVSTEETMIYKFLRLFSVYRELENRYWEAQHFIDVLHR
jgi:hypothetical protein